MMKILLAVDDTKSSVRTIETLSRTFNCFKPEQIVLLYVQKMEGASVMDELLLSDSEMATLKASLDGTEYQQKLDQRAKKILAYFENLLAEKGLQGVKAVVREGHPAEEILGTAREEAVDLIVIGSRSKRLHNLFMGSVSREVSNRAEASVLLIR